MQSRFVFILHADVAGSTSLVRQDEKRAHRRIQQTFQELGSAVKTYNGRVVESRGDALLAEFELASDAVSCAIAFQREHRKLVDSIDDHIRPVVRVGIATGEVVVADNTVTGAGVVIAQRIEQLTEPGGVCITGAVHEALPGRMPFDQDDMGEREVKGFDEKIRVYSVSLPVERPVPPPQAVGRHVSRRKHVPVYAVTAALVAAVIIATILWMKPWTPAGDQASTDRMAYPLPDKPSIAVLPFDNLSDDREQEYFVDGMTEDLITDLSKLSGLFVIARNSAFAYKGRNVKVSQVAEELGVRYVMEGSVRRAGDKIRINAQLIDATTGGHLWADRFDRDYGDIFALQDEVVENIIDAMAVRLTADERKHLERIPTTNLEAYDYYMRAEQKAYGSIRTVNVALGLYQKAVDLDPDFAEAHAGYARTAVDIWRLSYDNFLTNPVAERFTYEAASRALELDPDMPRAYTVLGLLQLVERAFDEAVESGRRAVELGPNSADAHLNHGIILAYAGRSKEAVDAVEMALRLDPDLSPRNLVEAGFIYFTDRQPRRALELLEKSRSLLPGNERVTEYLAVAYARAGKTEQARREMAALNALYPFTSLSQFRTYYGYYRNESDLEYYIGAMQEAGLPEWPFGYEGEQENRLSGEEISPILFGRAWKGKINRSQVFFQETGEDGAYAYRSGVSFVVGQASLEDDMLCLQTEATNLGFKQCGWMYRNPDGGKNTSDEYTYVHPFFLLDFSLTD